MCYDCGELGQFNIAVDRSALIRSLQYKSQQAPAPTTTTTFLRPTTVELFTPRPRPTTVTFTPQTRTLPVLRKPTTTMKPVAGPLPVLRASPVAMPAKAPLASGGGKTTGGTVPTFPAEIAAETAGVTGKPAINPMFLLAAAAGVYLLTKKKGR